MWHIDTGHKALCPVSVSWDSMWPRVAELTAWSMVPIYGESRVQLALIHTDPARAIHSSAAFTLGVVLYAKPIITRLAMVFLVCYECAKKPAFG